MNIAIDLTPIPKKKNGVGRYAVNLVDSLQMLDHRNRYFLFIQDDDLAGFPIHNANFSLIPVRSAVLRIIPARFAWEQLVLPFKLRKSGIDMIHSLHYTMPYLAGIIPRNRQVKFVVTFHDMSFFLLPKMHTFFKRTIFKAYIRRTAKMASAILAVSDSAATNIAALFPCAAGKVAVAPNGVGTYFFAYNDVDISSDAILKAFGIDFEYFLFVGTIEPRKNIVGILEAYNKLDAAIRNRYKLVVCGEKGWKSGGVFKYIKDNKLQDNVHFTGFADDRHLTALYRNARLFIFVPFHEGFGIPLLEAMASGTPCITSNVPPMSDIAGGACILADPYDTDDIKRRILSLLADDALCSRLCIDGKKRASLYTWEICAQNTLMAYERAYSGTAGKGRHGGGRYI